MLFWPFDRLKVLLQRVSSAEVAVAGERIAGIGRGLMLLVGFGAGDDQSVLPGMARRVAQLRVFPDQRGRLHHSVLEIDGGVLAVPQFTLYANLDRGRRPEFTAAMAPEPASRLFDAFVEELAACGIREIASGRFGAHMAVALCNDGPVTLMLEREPAT